MTNPMVRIITGTDVVDREMTDAENAVYQTEQAERLAHAKTQIKAETDKATARQAVLDRLGITADEAALLLS
jgi:succinyl-CoA synthetase alpha subunit